MNAFPPTEVTLKDGRSALVRAATPDDAPALSAHLRSLAGEAPYICMTPGEVSSDERLREEIMELRERPGSLVLLGEAEGRVVGDCWMTAMSPVKMRHVGRIGMAIAEGWRGVGLGRALLAPIVEHARTHPAILRLELDVFERNAGAIRLYESLGFVREGLRPARFRQDDGALLADVSMGMWVGPDPAPSDHSVRASATR